MVKERKFVVMYVKEAATRIEWVVDDMEEQMCR
jgi:hypothetical protein